MHRFSDIHTHVPGRSGTVLSISASELDRMMVRDTSTLHDPGAFGHQGTIPSDDVAQYYSLQLHPWDVAGDADIAAFEAWGRAHAQDPRFVAIGECGLDPLCPTPPALQHKAFAAALRLAKELKKPVIIHCVRQWSELTDEVSQVFTLHEREVLPLIIHGFRKGPELARQLLAAGFSLSLGRHFNEATRSIIPPDRLYFETDDTA